MVFANGTEIHLFLYPSPLSFLSFFLVVLFFKKKKKKKVLSPFFPRQQDDTRYLTFRPKSLFPSFLHVQRLGNGLPFF